MFFKVIRKAKYRFTSLLITGLVLALLVSFGISNCGPGADEGTKPEVLRLGLIPAEDIEEMAKAFEPVRQYLEKELGIPIEVFKATDYTAVIEAMRAKKVDVAYFGPFSYVLAAKRANAQAIVAGGDADGKLATYHSTFVTHKDSGLKSVDDVKARDA